ncbi:MAG: hypothetical protein ACQKBY_09155 [Verrucomicrobiales bacterium]
MSELSFSHSPTNLFAEIPDAPGLFGTGTVSNSDTEEQRVGVWDLEVSGAAASYLAHAMLTGQQAVTRIGGGVLEFAVENEGALGDLLGLGVAPTWSASAVISGSENWQAEGDTFRYVYDLEFGSGVLGLDVGIFPKIGLEIKDGSGAILFRAENAGDLLGLTSLTSTSYQSQVVEFMYDKSNGPLEVTWFASELLGLDLLNSTSTLASVSNTRFEALAVPEFKISVLMLAPVLFFGLKRPRRRWQAFRV